MGRPRFFADPVVSIQTLGRLGVVALLACLGACVGGKESPDVPAAGRPNIVFILADDLGYGDLSCYGQTHFQTPNIDRLAAEGMRFTDHYSGSTVCAPSRASLMTGLHTGHSPIRGNREAQPIGQEPLPADHVTVAEVLHSAGYATGAVGKWGLGPPESSGEPNAQGFDFWFGYLCQRNAHRYYPPFLWRNREQVALPENANGARGQYSHDLLTREALDFIRRNKDGPFFLYLPYTIPHADLDVPEDSMAPFRGQFDVQPYSADFYQAQEDPGAAFAGMVSRLDRDVGRILDLLQAERLERNTLVIFTSDNGPHAEGGANPGFFKSSGSMRGMKRDLYEGGIRAPFSPVGSALFSRVWLRNTCPHFGISCQPLPNWQVWRHPKASMGFLTCRLCSV